ncbi:hypothetical protein E6Q11_00565 [Candidatus Dojkabacteria bacterium]|uniref:Uncharacterized protein n=1 Tax=Candidatus Dojkabacteria bacterium TaxID=2099670 RepID=A0A5C7JC97_9BACT|nr:MAG: hypothetical protein E6Q11_00565 [Candidatus Dojkabacteria bacterium]
MGIESEPRQLRRVDLMPAIPTEADETTPLLDFAEAAWDEEMAARPEIDPEDLGAQLTFVHEKLGLSNHSTYGVLGRLLGGESAHTAEQMLRRGTSFGNKALRNQTRFLFAGVSIVERRTPDIPGQRSLAGDRVRILQTTQDREDPKNPMSAWRLFEAAQPDLALAILKKAAMHNEEQE